MKPAVLNTKLLQYETLIQFFRKHETILKSKRGFQTRFDRFCIKKSVISVTAAHLEIISGDNIKVNNRLRKTLCELAESIVAVITHSGHEEYTRHGGCSADVLEEMNDEQLIGYCRSIYQLLLEHPDAFIKQGIVLQVRNTFSGAIDVFSVRVSNPVAQASLIKHFEQLLEKLFADMEYMLKIDMDTFIARLRLMKPLLVSEYRETRKKG